MPLKLVNSATNPGFNELFSTEIFHLQPCRFAYIQTGTQTDTTSILRQINPIYPIFSRH